MQETMWGPNDAEIAQLQNRVAELEAARERFIGLFEKVIANEMKMAGQLERVVNILAGLK